MEVCVTGSLVLYNNPEKDIQNVISCFLNTEISVRLFVIDNSEGDSLKVLINDERVEYYHNPSNPGFGTSHNIGIQMAIELKSDFHLIMNPDIYYNQGTLEKIINFLKENSSVGMLMPKVLYPDQSIQYLCKILPDPGVVFFRRFFQKMKWTIAKNEKYELRKSGYNRIMNVPYLSGCFMMCRTKALKEVHGFDERFFMYFEDTDLSRRIHMRYRTIFYPETEIYHKFGKTSFKNNKLLFIHIVSAIKYFNKWGWFFDKERKEVNMKTIQQFSS